jgi:hypothetical protein
MERGWIRGSHVTRSIRKSSTGCNELELKRLRRRPRLLRRIIGSRGRLLLRGPLTVCACLLAGLRLRRCISAIRTAIGCSSGAGIRTVRVVAAAVAAPAVSVGAWTAAAVRTTAMIASARASRAAPAAPTMGNRRIVIVAARTALAPAGRKSGESQQAGNYECVSQHGTMSLMEEREVFSVNASRVRADSRGFMNESIGNSSRGELAKVR